MGVVSTCLRYMPAEFLQRVGWTCLRAGSPHWRAWSDLFVAPYDQWMPWHSGLGDATHVMYALVRGLRPRVIVEVGTARGRSACAMALACRENGVGRVVAIDPHDSNNWNDTSTRGTTERFLRERVADYQLETFVDIRVATSVVVSPTWTEPIDLLFIDGDHTYKGVKEDFEGFRKHLSPHALVVFHDSAWEHEQPWEEHQNYKTHPFEMGVPRFLDELQRQGFQSITFPQTPGLTILDPNRNGFGFLAGLQAMASVPR